MAYRIYTKTGDKGQTALIGGRKVSKAHGRIEAYGTVDELNAFLGLARDQIINQGSRAALLEIQNRLFVIGSTLATETEKETKMELPSLEPGDISFLETAIDTMDEKLPPMRNFILPGGSTAISTLHIARTVCRRAERNIVALREQGENLEELVLIYLNRLSDYLFMLARYTAMEAGIEEIPWRSHR